MKDFNIMGVHWKIGFLGGERERGKGGGGFTKKPIADLRGDFWGWCFWGGGGGVGGDTPKHTMIDVWQGSKYVSGEIFLQVFDLILLICWNKMVSPISNCSFHLLNFLKIIKAKFENDLVNLTITPCCLYITLWNPAQKGHSLSTFIWEKAETLRKSFSL